MVANYSSEAACLLASENKHVEGNVILFVSAYYPYFFNSTNRGQQLRLSIYPMSTITESWNQGVFDLSVQVFIAHHEIHSGLKHSFYSQYIVD